VADKEREALCTSRSLHKITVAGSLRGGHGTGGAANAPIAGKRGRLAPTELLLQDFLEMPYLFLNFAEVPFDFASSLQGRIVRDFAYGLLYCAFYFMDIGVDLVLRTGLHLFSPFRQITNVCGSPRRGV
jgi:hypothetical protein